MNTRIEKDFNFQTALHFADSFHINVYDITISLLVETDSIREQNVAMDRIVYFLNCVLQNSILVDAADLESIEKYEAAGIKVCTLPEEPWDQIFATVLLLKLNALMEGRLKITDLVLGSSMSEGVRYTMVCEVAESMFSGNHWWNKCSNSMSDCELYNFNSDNIVKLFDDDEWADLGLSWKEKTKK